MGPYDFAVEKVKEAGNILLAARERGVEVGIKGGNVRDIVTSADREVNDFLLSSIRAAFPTHRIYSEEGGDITEGAEEQWVVDPIDGSANFSRGIPHYAICLGLVVNEVPLCGAVYNPVTSELFSFKKGEGAWLNGNPLYVSRETELKNAHVFFHAGRNPEMREWGGRSYERLLQSVNKTKNFSAISLDICFVAAGRLEANIYGALASTLELAPALGILTEAGGVYTVGEKIYMANSEQMLRALHQLLD